MASSGNSTLDQYEQANRVKKLADAKLMTTIRTPYTPDGRIDIAAFDKHVAHQVENNVQGLVVATEVGDS